LGFQACGLVPKLTELFSLSVCGESEVNHEPCIRIAVLELRIECGNF